MADKKIWEKFIIVSCVLGAFLVAGCATPAQKPEKKRLYTAYNVWYEKPSSISCINYKRGKLLSAGTEISNLQLWGSDHGSNVNQWVDWEDRKNPRDQRFGTRRLNLSYTQIAFTAVPDGKRYRISFRTKYHPGKNIDDFVTSLVSEKNFAELTEGLSEMEVKAITDGSLVKGMSKRAVIISYGAPPEHRTPDLERDCWIYWLSRFKSKKFCFDSNERFKGQIP